MGTPQEVCRGDSQQENASLFRAKRAALKNAGYQRDGELFRDHSGVGTLERARDFFLQQGVGIDAIAQMITHDNRLVTPEITQKDLYSMAPYEADRFFRERLNPILAWVDFSLNAMGKHGFNSHGVAHTDEVARITRELLQKGGFNEGVQTRGIIAARAHDIGNLLGRERHSLISVQMLAELFPALKYDLLTPEAINDLRKRPEWKILRKAIELHDSGIAEIIIKNWGTRTAEQTIKRMQAEFSPEALALIIADKVDMGRSRLTSKNVTIETVNEDSHLAINLLGETEKINLNESATELSWQLRFRPEEDEQHPQFNKRRSKHNGLRVIAPDMMHERHHDGNPPVPHADTWRHQFWNLYFDRIKMMIFSSFALFPKLEKLAIEVSDPVDPYGNRRVDGERVTMTFVREYIDEDLDYIRTKYHPKDKREGLVE